MADAAVASSSRPEFGRASSTYSQSFATLRESEVVDFYKEIVTENRGFVTLDQLTEKLEDVVNELSPASGPLRLDQNEDAEAGSGNIDKAWLRSFVQELFPNSESTISQADFIAQVGSWNVQSPSETAPPSPRPPLVERLRARWEVDGPRIAFRIFIDGLIIGFGLWQMIQYIRSPMVRSAFGGGVILSKATAGALYPIFFFLLLSMSRYFATLIRRFKHVPRFINWDRSTSTHIGMGLAGLAISTLHGIGYLAGSFVQGSKSGNQAAVEKVFAPSPAPKSYVQFVRTLPGWSGITALGLFWIISILSLPIVRSKSYEIFQISHLLMFPLLGLLCAHGTEKILQDPMLGYWLAFPLFLVLLERSTRLAHGCRKVPARLEILDNLTATVTFDHPRGNWWNYEAGQYVFLQVPSISFFQWHPFTVSNCSGKSVQVHIQTSGNWTRRLRSLPTDRDIQIGVDGPFGAPSQRFYEFDRAIVLGAGVGITPFSAIMTDLEQKLVNGIDPWSKIRRTDDMLSGEKKSISLNDLPASLAATTTEERTKTHAKRRVDFFWIVRESEDLLWFSSLLNRAYDLSQALPASSLDLNINTYITTRRRDLSTHIFRYLLDSHRSPSTPYSALTGLKMRSRLGRPDVAALLLEYHNDLKRLGWTGGRVGVFFCGRASVGRLLAEACRKVTAMARKDGSKTKYILMMEVFG